MGAVPELRPVGRVSAEMRQVIGSWSALAAGGYGVSVGPRGVDSLALEGYESATGGGYLPPDLRALYAISSEGFQLIELMIDIHAFPPVSAADYGIEQLEAYPTDQVHVFGTDMGDNAWAFWLQRGEHRESPPVMVLVGHSMAEIRSVGRVAPFLRLETAAGLMELESTEAVVAALDALGVPDQLRGQDPGQDSTATALMRWAGLTRPGQDSHYLDWEPLSGDQLEGLARDLR